MPQKDRIIIDTNLWISFLLTSNYSRLDKIINNNSCTLLFSQELLDEFITVAHRPKFKKYFASSELHDLMAYLSQHALFIEVESDIKMCRDPKDNFLLSLAVDGKATHLITSDKDLLLLEKVEKTEIVTIQDYLKQM